MRSLGILLGAVFTGALLTLSAIPATAQEVVSASPDITIDLGASVITSDEDVAVDNQLGIVILESLGTLPDASDVIALGLDVNGDRLIAFDTTTLLLGNVVARPGDVIRYDGASYSIEFDASAAGIPMGVMTDAASLAAGGLLLSFDTTVDLGGGLIAADAKGVFNFTNEGIASWYDFAVEIVAIARRLGMPIRAADVRPIPAKEFPTPAARALFAANSPSAENSIVPTDICSARKPSNMQTPPPSVTTKKRNAARGAPFPPHRRISR